MGASDVVGSVRPSVRPSVRSHKPERVPVVLAEFTHVELKASDRESVRPSVRARSSALPLYHLPPSSTPSHTYGLHGRGALTCSLRNDREDRHNGGGDGGSSSTSPCVFLSFSANDHSREKGGGWGGDSINGRSLNRLVSGGSFNPKHADVHDMDGRSTGNIERQFGMD